MLLDLSQPQVDLLREVLSGELKGLLAEIAHTDSREYRDDLKERHAELEAILYRLRTAAVPIDVGPLG